jgi:hypothetical protein
MLLLLLLLLVLLLLLRVLTADCGTLRCCRSSFASDCW